MKHYVAGFLFSSDFERVVLIEKQKPDWQKGLLNGVGGKIEPGETPEEAMRREFMEETGMDVEDWTEYTTLGGEGWRVHFFYGIGNVEAAVTLTDELVLVRRVDDLWALPVIQNLQWLIPMAITFGNGTENAARFTITETPKAAVV